LNRIPPPLRLLIKALLTLGAFALLLLHEVDVQGERVTIFRAIADHLSELELAVFVPLVLTATLIKFVGIFASMLRWHLLLRGQGIRFNFGHVVGSFLIGRFLGTFLPSTVGLDGYKLYDASRFSERTVEAAAATAVEKVMGLSGIFLCFLVALPLGYTVLGVHAGPVAAVTVPIASAAVLGLFALLFWPGLMRRVIALVPAVGRGRLTTFSQRLAEAASAYRSKGRLLWAVIGLSFLVHFCTAAMYFFTALAVGAAAAHFWEVTLASTIQIFATVMSPFTIAGEGVREIVQALLLAKRIGTSESVLSAALGFWAAEALTLGGAVFLWMRGPTYRPRLVEVTPRDVASPARAAS
jgi:glycosyltransferase 2 family protein